MCYYLVTYGLRPELWKVCFPELLFGLREEVKFFEGEKLMEKKNNKKGFTLAELLIVVAIIAVLVAIAIPIFNAQLEKSREATDTANLRSAYAEAVATYLSEGNCTSTISVGGATYNVTETSGSIVVTATTGKSKKYSTGTYSEGGIGTGTTGGGVTSSATSTTSTSGG